MQAVIFDLDGTLVDSEGIHQRGLEVVAAGFGMSLSAGGYVGLGDEESVRRIYEANGRPLDADASRAFIEAKSRHVQGTLGAGGAVAYDGAVETVRELALRVPVGICTASLREEAELVVESLGLGSVIGALVAREDVPSTKPAPDGYLRACEMLGAEPGGCVAVEDSANGLASALDAGLVAVCVLHTTGRDALRGAHAVHERIGELTPAVLRGYASV